MEFAWSERDAAHRENVRSFLGEALPSDWEALSQGGPGSDAQARYSKRFCHELAERGWLTPHWPREFGGRTVFPWRPPAGAHRDANGIGGNSGAAGPLCRGR